MEQTVSSQKIKNKPILYKKHFQNTNKPEILKYFPKYLDRLSYSFEKLPPFYHKLPTSTSAVISRIKRMKIIYRPALDALWQKYHVSHNWFHLQTELIKNKNHSVKVYPKNGNTSVSYLKNIKIFRLNVMSLEQWENLRFLPNLECLFINEVKEPIPQVHRRNKHRFHRTTKRNPDYLCKKKGIKSIIIALPIAPVNAFLTLLSRLDLSEEFLCSVSKLEIEVLLGKLSHDFWPAVKFKCLFRHVSSLSFSNIEDEDVLGNMLATLQLSPKISNLKIQMQQSLSKSGCANFAPPLSYQNMQNLTTLDLDISINTQNFIYFIMYFSMPKSLKFLRLGAIVVDWKLIMPELERVNWKEENILEENDLFSNFFNQWQELRLDSLKLSFFSYWSCCLTECLVESILKRLYKLDNLTITGISTNFEGPVCPPILDLNMFLGSIYHLKSTLRTIEINNFETGLWELDFENKSFPNLSLFTLDGKTFGEESVNCLFHLFDKSILQPIERPCLQVGKFVITDEESLAKFLKRLTETFQFGFLSEYHINIGKITGDVFVQQLVDLISQNRNKIKGVSLYIDHFQGTKAQLKILKENLSRSPVFDNFTLRIQKINPTTANYVPKPEDSQLVLSLQNKKISFQINDEGELEARLSEDPSDFELRKVRTYASNYLLKSLGMVEFLLTNRIFLI